MRKEETQEQVNREAKQGRRFAARNDLIFGRAQLGFVRSVVHVFPWRAEWPILACQILLDQSRCMFLVRLIPISVGSPRQDSVYDSDLFFVIISWHKCLQLHITFPVQVLLNLLAVPPTRSHIPIANLVGSSISALVSSSCSLTVADSVTILFGSFSAGAYVTKICSVFLVIFAASSGTSIVCACCPPGTVTMSWTIPMSLLLCLFSSRSLVTVAVALHLCFFSTGSAGLGCSVCMLPVLSLMSVLTSPSCGSICTSSGFASALPALLLGLACDVDLLLTVLNVLLLRCA